MLTWNYIKYVGSKVYKEGSCLSSDTKPTNDNTLLNGSKLIEMNTSTMYLFDEANKTWRAYE